MSKSKSIKRSIYILTEGHTEQAYFSRISEILGDDDEWRYSVTVDVREIEDGCKTDPVGIVKEAKNSQKLYDEVWAVFDKDRERDIQNVRAIELARKFNIKLAFSSIAFEQWILLHFEKSSTSFERSDCQSRGEPCSCNGSTCISSYIKRHHYPTYTKGKAKLYDDLSDKNDIAMEYTAWLRFSSPPSPSGFHLLNPYTDVDNLVALLLGLPVSRYSSVDANFFFEGITFCITHHKKRDDILEVSIHATSDSQYPFIFNNAQKNVTLLDVHNTEVPYIIPEAEIIHQGDDRTVNILFPVGQGFQISRLRFQSEKECIHIEL